MTNRTPYRLIVLLAILSLAINSSHVEATQRTWTSGTNSEWNTTNGAPWGGTAPVPGDTVKFPGSGTVFIGTGGVPQDVFVGGEMLLTNGGGTYNFSGGDIKDFGATPANIRNVWDTSNNFNYGSSLSFTGGTSIGDAAATNKGFITYNLSQSSGAFHFGTGNVALGPKGSVFTFAPLAGTAQLTNTFTVAAQSSASTNVVVGPNNPLASTGGYTGNFTLDGNLVIRGQNAWQNTLVLTGDRTLSLGDGNQGVTFNGNINGAGIYSVTLASSDAGQVNPTDWSVYLSGSGGWNVKNVTKTNSVQKLQVYGDQLHYFDGVKANGGKVIVAEGWMSSTNSTASAVYNVTAPYQINGDPDGAGPKNLPELRASYSSNGGTINIGALDGSTVLTGSVSGGGIVRAGTINVNNGGTVSPGSSAGILTFNGNTVFNSGSTLNIEVTGGGATAGVDYDVLTIVGTVSGLNNLDLVIDINALLTKGDLSGDVLTILTETGTNIVSGSFHSITFTTPWHADVTFLSNSIILSNFQSTIPEPSTLALLGLGVVGMAIKTRRRRAAMQRG